MSTTPFSIPDTSPVFNYSPCEACGSSGTWQSAYQAQGDGYDATFHQSSGEDFVVTFNISALEVDIQTSTDGSSCSATYSLDGGQFSPGCQINFPSQGWHNVVVKPQAGTGAMQFYGITGSSSMTAQGSSWSNVTIDDTSSSFSFSDGDWTHIDSQGAVGPVANQTAANLYSNMGDFFNSSGSITTAQGGRIDLTFSGAAIYLYGVSSPNGGMAQVFMDGQSRQTLTLNNSGWTAYSSLLYFETGFNASDTHNLSLVNFNPGGQLVIDYALTSTPQQSKNCHSHIPIIVGTIAGASAVLLLLGVLLFFSCTKKSRQSRSNGRNAPYPFAIGFENAKASSIDKWRLNTAEAVPQTPISSATGSSGSRSRRAVKDRLEPFGQSHRSPPPDYPEFLPYRAPDLSLGLTGVVGASPAAQGWLSANSRSPGSPGRSLGSNRSGHSGRSTQRQDPRTHEDIAMSDYSNSQQNTSLSRTTSFSSSVPGGLTAEAVRATGSVAKLWPTQRPERLVVRESAQYTPSYTMSSNLVSPPDHLVSSDIGPQRSMSDFPRSLNDTPSRPATPLRRGVSIKSVKTMRSFFSGLLFNSSTSPMPTPDSRPPALPPQPARPDSGVFPGGSTMSRNESLRVPYSAITSRTTKEVPVPGTSKSAPSDFPALTPRSPPLALRTEGLVGHGRGEPPNELFIELTPNSPLTMIATSRPGSEMTRLHGRL